MKLIAFVLKNLRRSPLRTFLTSIALVVLVVLFSIIWSILAFLEAAMAQKEADIPIVITERYRIPSRFDRAFMDEIVRPGTKTNTDLASIAGFHPEKHTVWHFVLFTLDEKMQDKDQQFFAIATYPEKIKSMIDSVESLNADAWKPMVNPPNSRLEHIGILMGPDRLKKIKKKVGDVFKAWSMSHRDGGPARKPLEMDFEIVGELPGDSRWTDSAFMDYAYLDRVLKEKKSDLDGKVNLGWLKIDDQASASAAGGTIERNIADIKSEQASSAVGRFMDSYKGIMNGVKFLLVPAIIVVMVVIVANAISITVRERTTEMAVLKVLGYSPAQILGIVLGEGLTLGLLGGLFGAALVFVWVNLIKGGINFQIAFFGFFFISKQALWWGPLLGAATALLGSIVPAWSARTVKVSEVFAKVA